MRNGNVKVGSRLRQARARLALPQTQVADRCKIPVAQYSDYECNRAAPGTQLILKIAQALDVSTDFLLGHTRKLWLEEKPKPTPPKEQPEATTPRSMGSWGHKERSPSTEVGEGWPENLP